MLALYDDDRSQRAPAPKACVGGGGGSRRPSSMLVAALAFLVTVLIHRAGGSTPSCYTCTRRRLKLLDDGGSFSVLAPHWKNRTLQSYQDRCGEEEYELRLVIGIHFTFYARPSRDEALASCQPLQLHADSSSTAGKAKDVFEVDHEDLPPDFFESGSLPLGTFRFHDIADAFVSMEVNTDGEKDYNIVTNNCAVVILGTMRTLGIHLSSDDRAMVVKGLVAADVEADNRLADYIRESGEIERSLGLTLNATNGQLLERLTLRQISLALDSAPVRPTYSTDLLRAAAAPQQGSVAAANAVRRRADPKVEGRKLIVGGTRLTTQEFPFFVQSEEIALTDGYPDLPMCGAVLIAPDVILTTAGECYEKFQWSSRVLVGSTILSNTYLGAEWRDIVSDIIVHPQYKKIGSDVEIPEFVYDFAMMKIEAVTLPNLTPVVLNSDDSQPTDNQNLTIVGYGRTVTYGSYAPSPGLRKTTMQADNKCSDFSTYNASASLCAQAPRSDACSGDYGGPLLDSNNTLVGLLSAGTFCGGGASNLFSRVSGSLSWIQETLCKLSDYRANYTFCPAVVCPVDLTLFGELDYKGGATLPAVLGSMMTPPQENVTQWPPAGTRLQRGKVRTVTVTATDALNQTTNCQWVVRVPPMEKKYKIVCPAKLRNSALRQYYSLNVPFTAKFFYVDADLSKGVVRKNNAVVGLTFKREDQFNWTDSTFVQRFKVKGNKKDLVRFNVTAQLPSPDPTSYVYTAYFDASGIKVTGDVTYYLYGQFKKM